MPIVLEPEVAGSWGSGTVADTLVHPPVVEKFEHEFSDWLGDELLESFPCFLVSDRLAMALVDSPLTGYRLAALKVSRSREFEQWHSDTRLPGSQRLQIVGAAEVDDFWTNSRHAWVVSERALPVLRNGRLDALRDHAVLSARPNPSGKGGSSRRAGTSSHNHRGQFQRNNSGAEA